jgi:dihydrodipicolinate synthase/N-acetylneuraminate lyase
MQAAARRASVGDALLQQADARGPVQHYRAIGDAVGLPIVVYNVPGRTGVQRRSGDARALSEIRSHRA